MSPTRRVLMIALLSGLVAGGLLGVSGAGRAATRDEPPAAPPVPARPPIPPRQLWQGAGVIVDDAAAFDLDRARVLGRNRFRWVAVKIHHGLRRVPGNEKVLAGEWSRAFRQEGVRICGWGVLDGHPVREARLLATIVRRLELDCYIADAENAYMGTGYGGVVKRSAIFVRAFRARLGSLPAAVTTYGAAIHPWILPFDYGAWRDRGFALLPQAYLPIAAHYDPRDTLAHAVRAGYPQARIHPMLGIGWRQARRKHWGGDYVWRLLEARTKGFSVFRGETTSDADFDVLGRAIARYAISR